MNISVGTSMYVRNSQLLSWLAGAITMNPEILYFLATTGLMYATILSEVTSYKVGTLKLHQSAFSIINFF